MPHEAMVRKRICGFHTFFYLMSLINKKKIYKRIQTYKYILYISSLKKTNDFFLNITQQHSIIQFLSRLYIQGSFE